MKRLAGWRSAAERLKQEVLALYLACRDPRVPWYAKVFVGAVVAYALSPIDLIPDFIPVLGYVDDILFLPLGIYLAIKMIPAAVMAECREKARRSSKPSRASWVAAAVIVLIWIGTAAALLIYLYRALKS